jgi:hypothetical protein
MHFVESSIACVVDPRLESKAVVFLPPTLLEGKNRSQGYPTVNKIKGTDT